MRKRAFERERRCQLTDKGLAVLLAVKHGLCPKRKGGYDTRKFEMFWDEFQARLTEKRGNDQSHKEVKETCKDSDDRKKIVIRSIILGVILGVISGIISELSSLFWDAIGIW